MRLKFLLGSIFLFIHAFSIDVKACLDQIPQEDREYLDRFFQQLLREDPFAYTLFGDKPMSYTVDYTDCDSFDFPIRKLVLNQGWDAWVRYNHLFPSKAFILKRRGDEYYIIHKQHVQSVIRENSQCFRKKLGKEIDAILSELCEPDRQIGDWIDDSQLLGILLGFGKENAALFERSFHLLHQLKSKSIPPFSVPWEIDRLEPTGRQLFDIVFAIGKGDPPKKIVSSMADELNEILRKRKLFALHGSDEFLEFISAPVFMYYDETDELFVQNEKTRKTIRKAFQQAPFLEVVLKQWTDEEIE